MVREGAHAGPSVFPAGYEDFNCGVWTRGAMWCASVEAIKGWGEERRPGQ